MRFNNMTRYNDRKKDNSKYFMYAIVLAFITFLVLSLAFNVSVVVLTVLIRYWWASLICLLAVIFIKKRRRKSES